MENLRALFKFYEKRSCSKWWIGERQLSDRVGQLPRIIAAKIGYPTSEYDPELNNTFVGLDWKQAARALSVAGTTDLAYDMGQVKERAVEEAKQALKDMAGDAHFFGNGFGHLPDQSSFAFTPLSMATFDCGLIGFDSSNAFIFWAEGED